MYSCSVHVQIYCLLTEDASKKHPFPCPCSYRTALTHYIDITHPPRTHVLGELAEYTNSAEDKEFLLKMTHATEEGKVPCFISFNHSLGEVGEGRGISRCFEKLRIVKIDIHKLMVVVFVYLVLHPFEIKLCVVVYI